MPDDTDLKRYAQAVLIMGKIRTAAFEAWDDLDAPGAEAPHTVKVMMATLVNHLFTVMPEAKGHSNLLRHISFNQKSDFKDILSYDLPAIEEALVRWAESGSDKPKQKFGFEDLLHKLIVEKSLPLYRDHHYRQAVWEAYQAVYTEIRRRSGRTEDGMELIGAVFSTKAPLLVASDLTTETGINVHKGLMQMLQGAWQGFRNPLAHGSSDLRITSSSAARHMVFATLLLRGVDKAVAPKATT